MVREVRLPLDARGATTNFRQKTGSAEKRAKAFLLEIPIVGENFGQPFPTHRLHRNAIREAVTLVSRAR
jgi:hypothetical protein